MRNKTGIGWRGEARQPLMEGDEVLAPLIGRKVVAKVEHKPEMGRYMLRVIKESVDGGRTWFDSSTKVTQHLPLGMFKRRFGKTLRGVKLLPRNPATERHDARLHITLMNLLEAEGCT